MLHHILRSTAIVAMLGCTLGAQDVLGVSWSGNVYRIHSHTGVGVQIGTTGFGTGTNAMTVDASGRYIATYRTGSTTQLLVIDPDTGSGTSIATLSVDLRGMATDPSGTIFGVVDAPGNDQLYRIDVATSTATPIGPTGFGSLQGLTFHKGVLYGWDIQIGLVTINPATGVATDVNPAVGNPPGTNYPQLMSSDGVRLLAGRTELYVVDPASGVATLLGQGGYSDLRGGDVIFRYGKGCAGSGGKVPQLSLVGQPASPGTLAVQIGNGLAGAPYALAFGAPRASLSLGGCTLLLVPQVIVNGALDATGAATLRFSVPANVYGVLDVQPVILDPGAGPLQLSFGNALEVTIG